jgi:endonuclease YncB( thermonuclease family)
VLRVELGFDVIARVTVRLADLDTPERHTPDGKRASADAAALLASGPITVVATGDRTFARFVAHVYVNGESVAATLRAAGHEKRR